MRKKPAQETSAGNADAPTFRSSAVARLAGMPVATLRIWEQRYQAVRPATAATGHRLYTAADVTRVMLLRRLTGNGHAIGTLAALDTAQLQQLAQADAAAATSGAAVPMSGRGPGLAMMVVGAALAARLQRDAVTRQLPRPLRHLAVYESLAETAKAGSGSDIDLLLWQVPGLRPDAVSELQQTQAACRATHVAVVYRYGAAAATQAIEKAGFIACREPADDEALGRWLATIAGEPRSKASAADTTPASGRAAVHLPAAAPRRYDDATLTAIAGMAPRLACECPRHIAELLMQLSAFEAYSEGCSHRNADDAELHGHLQRVAGAARVLFEGALERLARHEGLPLR